MKGKLYNDIYEEDLTASHPYRPLSGLKKQTGENIIKIQQYFETFITIL